MQKKSSTLLDKLVSLVSDDHVLEVKQIVSTLTKINNFKYSINSNLPLDNLYKKIAYELQTEFQIFNFCIILVKNNIENLLYQYGDETNNDHSFNFKVSDDSFLKIKVTNSSIPEYLILSLNSYFEDIVHILYLKYILIDTNTTSYVDPLTNLTNRMSFQEEMKTLIPLAIREKMNIGVLLINIDRFRAVNDEHGDEFGDNFLKLYADTIKDTIRSSDMAVRFGGGEFLVLLINVDNESRTMSIGTNLKDKLADTYLKSPNGDNFKKTVCIGVSMFPEDSSDIHTVIKNAEVALSDASDIGRNQILRFEEDEISTIDFF